MNYKPQNKMRKIISFLLLSFVVYALQAQIKDPVKFKTELTPLSDTEAEVVFTATIDKGWHVYSTDLGDGGPIAATFNVDNKSGVELVGKLKPVGKEVSTFDKLFEMKVRYFENTAKFVQKVKLTGGAYAIEGYLEYGACDDESCLPPTQVPFKFSGVAKAGNAAAAKAEQPKAEQPEQKEVDKADKKEEATPVASKDSSAMMELVPATTTEAATDIQPAVASSELWKPVISDLQALGEEHSQKDMSWIYIFITGFLGGLLALFTPCVWPIIPMTVSFFLKRSKDKKKGIRDAWTYGASIVVIYVALGLAITLIFGASALNALSTNAIFNILFFLMLVIFAASFFGAFEIRLPSKWGNAVDSKAESTTGLLSIFLMAFTLSLVSFSCTGPIIGFLLVQVSTTGSVVAPAIGMLGFAIALALPFTLFALFPSWLKSMPKSGGWMNVIKVTLGFLELAFALKFLSVADLAYGWRLLDRETFLALWIVIFALLGFYLLGKIKFPHDDDDNKVGVTRFFMALISLAFAVYMVPGLWGAPLKAVSAFAPPMQTQDFNLYKNEVHAKFDDYDLGMEYARLNGKPVMLDFTGYGCVNCRKMEAAVWTDPKVSDLINNDYVLITLYVDNKTPLTEPVKIIENGTERTLRTVGDKWSYLQRVKFGANAQPFYVLLDNQGKPLNKSYAYNEDIPKYIEFLQTGLENYKKGKN
jgi:thiol:disulfide interchange protein